jgi:predicted nucleic acid-binding protein
MNAELMVIAAELARQLRITIYDACYAALSRINNIPLVTANPRHQMHRLGCEVIPLEQWGKR